MFKVLIYTHEYPPYRGGAGVYSYDLAKGLAALGAEVHVATTNRDLPNPSSTSVDLDASVYLHYLENWKSAVPSEHYFLYRLQLQYKFNIVVVTERVAQEVVAQMKYPFFRYASVIHGTEILNYFGPSSVNLTIDRSKMLRFYKNSVINIAGSKATLDLAERLLKLKDITWTLVRYGINPSRLPVVDTSRIQTFKDRYPAGTEFVFCLGRLDLDKGHEILIPAFRQVREQRPNARLLIGGDGPYRQRLTELRDSLDLNDCVDFLGNVSDVDLSIYFGLCDVFALPSKSKNRWEGFGLVYLEANYYGKPVVGGNEGGVPEAIDNGVSGLIVDPHCVLEVASAIISLLQDKLLREKMGQMGYQRVIDFYNSERMATETLRVIDTLLIDDAFTNQVRRYIGKIICSATYILYALRTSVSRILFSPHMFV